MTLEAILRNNERKIIEHCQRLLAKEGLPAELAGRLHGILADLEPKRGSAAMRQHEAPL